MLAIPVATISRFVWESSQEACTSAFRPRPSGIHNTPYPRSSTRRAKSAAEAALMPSIPTQTPSLPSSITILLSHSLRERKEDGDGTRQARRLGRDGRHERGLGGGLCAAGRGARVRRIVDPRGPWPERAGA